MEIALFENRYDDDLEATKLDIIANDLNRQEMFRWSCKNGQIALAKWLAENPNVDVHAYQELAFRQAYENGQIKLVKWLVTEHNVDVHAHNEHAFRSACMHGHIKLAKWLAIEHGVDVHAHEDGCAFLLTCAHGHTELAKWLLTEYDIDVHVNNERAFKCAFRYKHTEIINMFLNELNDNEFKYAIRDKTAYIINHAPMNNWKSCVIFGIPVIYCGELDESAVMAIIRPPKSARSY